MGNRPCNGFIRPAKLFIAVLKHLFNTEKYFYRFIWLKFEIASQEFKILLYDLC